MISAKGSKTGGELGNPRWPSVVARWGVLWAAWHEEASRGGGVVAGILCLMHGVVRRLGEKFQRRLGSPELQNRGGELTAPHGGREGCQRGVEWDPGRLRESKWRA